MFRIIDVDAGGGGKPVESSDEALVAPPPAGTMRWIDLAAQDERTVALLGERFGFHPLTLEDCLKFDQRPKVEEYTDYLFIVMHGFSKVPGEGIEVNAIELHAFLGASYVVTVHTDDIPAMAPVWKRLTGDPGLAKRGADFIYYLVADSIVDQNFQLLDDLSEALDDIEDAVLNRAERRELTHIFRLKKTLVGMRRVLSPQRDVFATLAKRGHACIKDANGIYFRDVYDHLVRIYESIDAARDLLGNALDAYLSMVAQRTNEIVKRLTILSAVFLPLTFITGFFGMNFQGLPMDSAALMWGAIGIMLAIPPILLLWFKRSGWL